MAPSPARWEADSGGSVWRPKKAGRRRRVPPPPTPLPCRREELRWRSELGGASVVLEVHGWSCSGDDGAEQSPPPLPLAPLQLLCCGCRSNSSAAVKQFKPLLPRRPRGLGRSGEGTGTAREAARRGDRELEEARVAARPDPPPPSSLDVRQRPPTVHSLSPFMLMARQTVGPTGSRRSPIPPNLAFPGGNGSFP
jgi:hypothetical protein